MAGPLSPKRSTTSSFSARAPWLPPATSKTGPCRGSPKRSRACACSGESERSGTGRPVTRYLRFVPPSTGNARKTRRANGSASRFARPRCASASLSAAGIRFSQAARTIGPATYPPPPKTTSGFRRASIRRQEKGATSACASPRASFSPGRREKPELRKESKAKPASGTSSASIRSDEPAKETTAPRFSSASATASAGMRCPAVPPAAIRHLRGRCFSMIHRDVKEDAYRHEGDNKAGASIGDKGKRDPGQRNKPEHGREIDRGLARDQRGERGRDRLPERVAAGERNPQSGPDEHCVEGNQQDDSDQPELLADH